MGRSHNFIIYLILALQVFTPLVKSETLWATALAGPPTDDETTSTPEDEGPTGQRWNAPTATGGRDDETTSTPEDEGPTGQRDPAPTATGGPDDEETTDDGPNTGVIAGAVVGSLAGVSLMIGAIVVAFRMGKERAARGDPETPRKSFKDTLRSIPRPVIHWTPGDPKSPSRETGLPVIQTNFPVEDPKRVAELSGTASTKPQVQARAYNQDSPGFEAQPYVRTENLGTELPAGQTAGTELPAGPDSQDWVRPQAQQLPYEMDAATPNKSLAAQKN
ncbi:hypothetical protein FALCPG4_015944 [Fusarium falciforme]